MGSGSGTWVIDGPDFVLPPTESWRLLAIMHLDTSSGSQGDTAVGSGFFDVTITPSPTGLSCLALLWPAILGRRARAIR